MTASLLLKLIPTEIFVDLAVETEVDFQVKKLSGEVMFNLILFLMLGSKKMRVMGTFLQSANVFTSKEIVVNKPQSISVVCFFAGCNHFGRIK